MTMTTDTIEDISTNSNILPQTIKPVFSGKVSYGNWQENYVSDVSIPVLTCKVEISPGIYLHGAAVGHYIWIDLDPIQTYYLQRHQGQNRQIIEVDPFFTVEALGKAFHNTITVTQGNSYDWRYRDTPKTVQKLDTYNDVYDYTTRQNRPGLPYNYLKVKITFMESSIEETLKFKQPESGEVDIDASGVADTFVINTDFFGLKSQYNWHIKDTNYRLNAWQTAWEKVKTCTFKQSRDEFLIKFFQAYTINDTRAIKGIEKRKEIKPILDHLQKEEPLLWAFYSFLKNGKNIGKMSNNRLLAAVLLDCGKNYKKFKKQIETVFQDTLKTDPGNQYSFDAATRTMCMRFPTAIQLDTKTRAKTEWNMREGIAAKAQGLGIHPRRHKNLMRAITQSKIALSIFHTTGDPLNLINVEFDLWERALRRKGWSETIISICNSVTNKNRFEKHITPYLSFLFRIEKYLKRHTGRNWTSFPSLVNSEAQLEMQERDENGTVKTRSALTPIVDNEKNTITVPYAGLKMYGAQTTYCYSKHYFVFEKDTIDEVSGSVIVNELEKKLNGRDDYGLMYYTLDGSVEAQGYPTFLIIFERRKILDDGSYLPRNTFVHFHRVHPSRKKDGKMVPACRLVEECYRYMAGNVRAEEIFAQQGDLIFIKTDKPSDLKMDDAKSVAEFESHRFIVTEGNSLVKLWPNQAKSVKNRLGFIDSDEGFVLQHPEHEWVTFPAGYYEIRRCKSWEANPSAVWSYTFD